MLLVTHLDGLQLRENPPVAVCVAEGKLQITNQSLSRIGQVVVYYGNPWDLAHSVQIWSLRAGESRTIPADPLTEGCDIMAVVCDGELYIQKEDS